MTQRAYKAIFFDLDGTLIPMDTDEFLQNYSQLLVDFFASCGFEEADLLGSFVFKSVYAMAHGEGDKVNADAFWEAFEGYTGLTQEMFEPFMVDFYTGPYNTIGEGAESFELAKEVIAILKEKGYPLYLTTMPLFPHVAIAERLKWVGLNEDMFEHITTYENSRFVKPMPEYYQESLDIAGLAGEDVLMIGNHATEDLAACQLDCDAFLVTDRLLNPEEVDISDVRKGSFEDLLEFCKQLPAL